MIDPETMLDAVRHIGIKDDKIAAIAAAGSLRAAQPLLGQAGIIEVDAYVDSLLVDGNLLPDIKPIKDKMVSTIKEGKEIFHRDDK